MKFRVLILLGLVGLGRAGDPPAELQTVINTFLGQSNTSIDILQTIHWRFYRGVDSLELHMDIRSADQFRILIPGFGLEIYGSGDSLWTVNHTRRQILLEKAGTNELLEQVFVGGDLGSARFVKGDSLGKGGIEEAYRFRDEYSQWQSLRLGRQGDILQWVELKDYDGNRYRIRLDYLPEHLDYDLSLPVRNPWHYDAADMRGAP